MAVVFSKPHALADVPFHYCPGCTHGIVHRLVAEVIDELGICLLYTSSKKPFGFEGCVVYFPLFFVEFPWNHAKIGRILFLAKYSAEKPE